MNRRALLKHLLLFAAYGSIGVLLAAVVALVLVLGSRPDLEPWHTADLDEEFDRWSRLETLGEYLALEDRVFAQLEREVIDQTGPARKFELNRYKRGSASGPDHWPRNWNRTFEFHVAQPRGVALLIHGLSDSPYSMRWPAASLQAAGVHVLGLRVPGHGTAPSGLVTTGWRDMAAAVELAMADLARRFPDEPIFIVGYSNGAALAINYTLDALQDDDLALPSRLVLIAPEIGVDPFAAFAIWQARLGHWLGMDKLAWNNLVPEFDPFKYGSFAVNAGHVAHRITNEIQAGIAEAAEAGTLADMPPILAFSSVVDATVRAPDLVSRLFNPLPQGGHELVLFDINRAAGVEHLLRWQPDALLDALRAAVDQEYALTLVTNRSPTDLGVREVHLGFDVSVLDEQPLDLAWPRNVYSLSHVALGFPANDPLYGDGTTNDPSTVHLGNLALRGERGVLQISDTAMLRQRWNPFYPYLETRMLEFLGLD